MLTITFHYPPVWRASILLEKLPLIVTDELLEASSDAKISCFSWWDWNQLLEPKRFHVKDMTLSVTAHHHNITCPYLNCGQERKQNDNADNPLCLGTQIHHESTHRYPAERLTSPMIYSVAITLYLLTMAPISRFSTHKANQISGKDLSIPLKYMQSLGVSKW